MKIERDTGHNYDEERLYLYQLLTNENLLSACRSVLKPELMSNKYTEQILRWLLEYYDVTGCAPGADTTSIFVKYKDTIDEDVANNIQKILESLSGDEEKYKINNVGHNTENIIKYFNWRALEELEKSLKIANRTKDVKYALELLQKFTRVEKTECDVYDPFTDHEQTAQFFNIEEERLFRLPGALGSVLGWFLRGDVVGMVAPQKAGKTWMSIFIESVALDAGLNVLYFNLEVTKEQFGRRIWQNLNAMPKEADVKCKLPHFGDDGDIYYDEILSKSSDLIIEPDKIKKRAQSLKLQKRGKIKVATFARGSATMQMLKSKKEQLEKEMGFIPDLIVIDNPDVMRHQAQGNYGNENKDEEQTWIDIAGWAQTTHTCIFAPTHGNRDSYGGKKIKIKALGGTFKKLAHVGKMIYLSMGEEEKKQCYARVGLFEGVERDDGSVEGGEAIVLHALSLGMWHVDSRFLNDTNIGRNELYK